MSVGLMNSNSSPVKLDKFQGVSVKKKKGDPSMNSLSCVAALAVSEGPGSFSSQSSMILILTKGNASPQAFGTDSGDLPLIMHRAFKGFAREAECVSVVKASSNSFTSWLGSSGYRAGPHFSCF